MIWLDYVEVCVLQHWIVFMVSYCILCWNLELCCVGTNRGEAGGFALDILSKLKDVKSKVSGHLWYKPVFKSSIVVNLSNINVY